MVRKILGQDEVIARIEAAYPGEYNYSKLRYRHSHVDFTLGCGKHGDFEVTLGKVSTYIKKGIPLCGFCNGEVFFDEETFREELKDYLDPLGLSIVGFADIERKEGGLRDIWVELKHRCGCVFSRKTEYVRRRGFTGCPVCAVRRPDIRSTEAFLACMKETGNPSIVFSGIVWKTMQDKITGICTKHGATVTKSAISFIQGFDCRQCAIEDKRALKLKLANIKEALNKKKVGENK